VSSGSFNTNLNTIAATTGATGLKNATSSTPVIVNNSPTFSPTFQPTGKSAAKNNSTAIIASIVVVVFVIGIAGAFYYRYTLKKKGTVQISVDPNTQNPMTHRMTMTDGKMPTTDSEINLSPVKKTGSN